MRGKGGLDPDDALELPVAEEAAELSPTDEEERLCVDAAALVPLDGTEELAPGDADDDTPGLVEDPANDDAEEVSPVTDDDCVGPLPCPLPPEEADAAAPELLVLPLSTAGLAARVHAQIPTSHNAVQCLPRMMLLAAPPHAWGA